MNLLIMGVAGSGKGTMSKLISENYGITHISTGDMFRHAIELQTELGLVAQKYIDEGNLVPDNITIKVMEERLMEDDCAKGFLIDGFPRTINQAYALEEISKKINRPLELVINLNVDFDILAQRILGRMVCLDCGAVYHSEYNRSKVDGVCDKCGGSVVHRNDDTEEALKVRLQNYYDLTKPVLDYYRSLDLVVDIEGTRSVNEVWGDVNQALRKFKND